MADVRRGFTTGANEFFYLTEEEIKRRKIEKEFWMHKDEKGIWVPNYVIKSPRECKSIIVKPEELKYRVLMIHKDKKDLKGTRVLKYIKEGERRDYHKRPTCTSRNRWYDLGKAHTFSDSIWPYLYDIGHKVFWNQGRVFTNNVLYNIYFKNRELAKLYKYTLNSTLRSLLLELWGRVNYGEGVISIAAFEVAQLPVVDLSKLKVAILKRIEKLNKHLLDRDIESIFSELGGASSPEEVSLDKIKPDRRELDKIIMGEILGLTDEEQLEVYRAVIDLVRSRIDRAKSVNTRRKTNEGLDIDKLIEIVKEKLGENTLGKFYRAKILSQEELILKTLPHPTGKVKTENGLFGWRVKAGRAYIDCKNEVEAKYLKIFWDAGIEEIKIPENEKYLETILPDLEKLKSDIDTIINEYLKSIYNPKLRDRILHKLQQEIVKE